jgi:hypothetical protein
VSFGNGLSNGATVLGGEIRQGWWLVAEAVDEPGRIVGGPFEDRTEAGWAAAELEDGALEGIRPAYGLRRADGGLTRKPSPQDWAWLAHLGQQLERLPEDWDAELAEDDPLVTLVVEVVAALAEAGLQLHDAATGSSLGGVCVSPEPALNGLVVSWRQHDRMSVDQAHGADADSLVQQVMNGTVADVLRLRGFEVDAFGSDGGYVVRPVL